MLRRLKQLLKTRVFKTGGLSLKIRYKRNRPPLKHFRDSSIQRNQLFFSPQRPELMHTSLTKLLNVQNLLKFLVAYGIKSRKSSVILCDLALLIVSGLCSYDGPWRAPCMKQMERFAYTSCGFSPPHHRPSYSLFIPIISIYQKSHSPSKPLNNVAGSNLTRPDLAQHSQFCDS